MSIPFSLEETFLGTANEPGESVTEVYNNAYLDVPELYGCPWLEGTSNINPKKDGTSLHFRTVVL
jgi:hypothetical protein